jgi:hypothetical protein
MIVTVQYQPWYHLHRCHLRDIDSVVFSVLRFLLYHFSSSGWNKYLI